MAEERIVEKHEHTRTETDEGTTVTRREKVVEEESGTRGHETVIERETTIEKND